SGINQVLQSVSSIAGPALGTLAITYFSIGQVLYLDVIGAVLAIVSFLFVSIPHVATESKPAVVGGLQDPMVRLRAIHQHRGLRMLFALAMLMTFCVMPVAILFPLLTIEHYIGGKWEMTVVKIVWGVGMLLGGSVLGIFKVTT